MRRRRSVNDPVLQSKSRRTMSLPLAGQGFVVQSFDAPQPRWTGNHRDVLPLLVALQDFLWHSRELFVDSAVLLNTPHAAFWLCQRWSVKQVKFVLHHTHRIDLERDRS